jgi:hypothetical protein
VFFWTKSEETPEILPHMTLQTETENASSTTFGKDQAQEQISTENLGLPIFLSELRSQKGIFEVQEKLMRQLAAEENRLKGLGGENGPDDSGTDNTATKPFTWERPTNRGRLPEREFSKLRLEICEMLQMLL